MRWESVPDVKLLTLAHDATTHSAKLSIARRDFSDTDQQFVVKQKYADKWVHER